jgi:polysaccharide pyruvyl transferase WcaK-like protein
MELNDDRVTIARSDLTVAELLWLYGTADLVVATRLHSGLLAFATGTPVVHLMYDRVKQPGVLEMFGLTEWGSDVAQVDETWLLGRMRDALSNGQQLRALLMSRVVEARLALDAGVLDAVARIVPGVRTHLTLDRSFKTRSVA